MASYESADLMLKLYELRRESRMREARDWFALRFNPRSFQDVMAVLEDPDAENASFRMVLTYWDMAAALVNHGTIDEQLFADVHAEHVAVFAKVEPFLPDLREAVGNPTFLGQLEQLVMRLPSAMEQLAQAREKFRELATRLPETTAAAT